MLRWLEHVAHIQGVEKSIKNFGLELLKGRECLEGQGVDGKIM
jgi:hypothetical protein